MNSWHLERRLYAARKRVENGLSDAVPGAGVLCEPSNRTIVYKGCSPRTSSRLLPDLSDREITSALALSLPVSAPTHPSWERAHPNRLHDS